MVAVPLSHALPEEFMEHEGVRTGDRQENKSTSDYDGAS
jgi:hypothetical protein